MNYRVTVTLNRSDPLEEAAYLSEWGHERNYASNRDGCRLKWYEQNEESFFPWSSVLRVDWSPCDCDECKRAVPKDTA